jgi:hypothetical protein
MGRHAGVVLVDTNTILDAHRMGAWPALAKGYGLETVQECVTETNTGFQRRKPEETIDPVQLEKDFKAVHTVTELDKARVQILAEGIYLDHGELCLWAHALTRNDGWVLCGPDKASLRFGVRMKCRDRMISLERLLTDAGYQPKGLRENQTAKWLDRVLGEFAVEEAMRKP